jgi:hypothetical protein
MSITTEELAAFVKEAAAEKWGYVYGGQGQIYTPELAKKWAGQGRAGKSADYFLNDCRRWFGKVVVDCSGLLVEAFRSRDKGYYDRTANTFRAQAVERGSIHDMPGMPGLGVWRSGHIGIYIGADKVIEAGGTRVGVVKTPLSSPATGKAWKEWLHLRGVICDCPPGEHEVPEDAFNVNRLLKLTSPMMSGDDVHDVQEELMARKYSVGGVGADGVYGPDTAQAVQQFQRDKGLQADGIVGPKTTTALGGLWEDAKTSFVVARLLKLTSPMMSGEDVQSVQEALMAQDYDVGVNGADGVYGPDTAKAVQRFQRDKKLQADGIVGPETAQALGGQWIG